MAQWKTPVRLPSPARADRPGAARNAFYLFLIVASIFLIYLFAYRQMRFFTVPTKSMTPTLMPQDYLLTLKHNGYRKGDVVVLDDPANPGDYLVKRIVAIGGDSVSVEGGALILNGSYASEPYLVERMTYRMPAVTVPEESVFVLGDNRNNSEDSHTWVEQGNGIEPYIPVEKIIGRVHYIYLPFGRMQRVLSYPLRGLNGG